MADARKTFYQWLRMVFVCIYRHGKITNNKHQHDLEADNIFLLDIAFLAS